MELHGHISSGDDYNSAPIHTHATQMPVQLAHRPLTFFCLLHGLEIVGAQASATYTFPALCFQKYSEGSHGCMLSKLLKFVYLSQLLHQSLSIVVLFKLHWRFLRMGRGVA